MREDDQEENIAFAATRRPLTPSPTPTRNVANTAAPTFSGEVVLQNISVGSPSVKDNTSISVVFSDNWEFLLQAEAPPPGTDSPHGTIISSAMKFVPTPTPTFEFRGPPVSTAPSSEAWETFELDHKETRPLSLTGDGDDFDGPYPLLNCQGDCDSDDDVSIWLSVLHA